jgi:hypothetical protein
MIAINIRGTGGSGKSTLVRKLIDLYPNHANILEEKRKRAMATCHWFGDKLKDSPAVRPPGLFVPGHYETDCGGCDTVKTVDKVYDLVRASALWDGNNVLYEGIMVMDDVTRAVAFDQDLKKAGGRLVVVSLTTTIDECLAGIRQRRGAEKEAAKPLNEKNTRDRMKRQENSLHRLKQAGVELRKLSREDAFLQIRELLGV